MLANWITVSRFPLLLLTILILYLGSPAMRLAGVALLFLGLMLDTVPTYELDLGRLGGSDDHRVSSDRMDRRAVLRVPWLAGDHQLAEALLGHPRVARWRCCS